MEEAQIGVYGFALPVSPGRFVQDGLTESRRRGVARRVFVYVEGRVEVGDAAPFVAQFVVDGQAVAVVAAVAVSPVRVQVPCLQGFAGSDFPWIYCSNSANWTWRYTVVRTASRNWLSK